MSGHGLEGMDPRKLLRMAAMGLDEEIMSTPWVWMCTMCFRCLNACPMQVNIPSLVYELRASWPRDKKPKGIIGSCNQGLSTEGASAVGISSQDFRFVVEDVLAEVRETQPRFKDLEAPIDKRGAFFFVNQNSREPVKEPERWFRCGRSCILPEPTGRTAPPAGARRIIACSRPRTTIGGRYCSSRCGRQKAGLLFMDQYRMRPLLLFHLGRAEAIQQSMPASSSTIS
jgi:ferredoxin